MCTVWGYWSAECWMCCCSIGLLSKEIAHDDDAEVMHVLNRIGKVGTFDNLDWELISMFGDWIATVLCSNTFWASSVNLRITLTIAISVLSNYTLLLVRCDGSILQNMFLSKMYWTKLMISVLATCAYAKCFLRWCATKPTTYVKFCMGTDVRFGVWIDVKLGVAVVGCDWSTVKVSIVNVVPPGRGARSRSSGVVPAPGEGSMLSAVTISGASLLEGNSRKGTSIGVEPDVGKIVPS